MPKAQVNGVTLDYSVVGSGRLIALAHSLGMSAEVVFEGVRPTLEQYGKLLTWDARGHGNSQKPATGFSVEDLAADLRGLIEHLGEDRGVIGGISMGGNTALAYAIAYPDKVDGLILIDTTAWYGENAPATWEERAAGAEANGMGPIVPWNTPRWFSPGFIESSPDKVQRVAGALAANDVPSYAAACRALGKFDGRAGLSKITCPTLIIVGEHDGATPPAMSQHLHENIPGSELHVLPDLKHLSIVEAPDRVGNLIAGFLDKLKQ